ncbi:protein of unknown function [Caballeronia sp. S22]
MQARMAHEIGKHVRRAVLLDIGRRSARNAVHRAEPRRNESGIRQIGREHDGHVIAFVEQVRHPLRERQIDLHRWMALLIARDHRHDVVLAEARHRMDLELAGRTRVGVAGFGFGLIDIGKNLLATLQIALARFGERDAPRRAIQQARAQMRFEVRYGPRGVGRRRIEMLRGRGEAARFDDPHKYAHVLERVHGAFPSSRTVRGSNCCTARNNDYHKYRKNALHPYGLFDNPRKNIITPLNLIRIWE